MVFVEVSDLRTVPDQGLVDASKEESNIVNTMIFGSQKANFLRTQLGWDMTIPLENLPLQQLGDFFSTLFARVTKVDDTLAYDFS